MCFPPICFPFLSCVKDFCLFLFRHSPVVHLLFSSVRNYGNETHPDDVPVYMRQFCVHLPSTSSSIRHRHLSFSLNDWPVVCLLLCNIKNNRPVSTRQWTATFRYTSTTSSLNSCVVVVVVVVVRPLHARAWSCFCLASVVSMGYYSLPAVELNRLPELLRARRERESTPSSPPLSCLQPKKDTILCYLSS